MLRLGILGLGEGRSTMSAALSSLNYKLVKVCDQKIERCQQRTKAFDFQNYTVNYQDLLDDPTLDVIAIYTPDKFHADHTKQVKLHGKHVVCNKPFIDDLSKAKELIDFSNKTGKKVFVGRVRAFSSR